MLDLEYPSLRAFVRDCRSVQRCLGIDYDGWSRHTAADYEARMLLTTGVYVVLPDGRVVASSCL
jgi:hypothetical protein